MIPGAINRAAAQFGSPGGVTFRCGVCRIPKSVPGRRRQQVGGVLQYVCAACADARAKGRNAA